jgi:hypothetical protein
MGVGNREDFKVMGSSGFGQGLRNFIITGNTKTRNLEKYFSTKKFNFEEPKSVGLQRKHAVGT